MRAGFLCGSYGIKFNWSHRLLLDLSVKDRL
jgi:hypothetical protein